MATCADEVVLVDGPVTVVTAPTDPSTTLVDDRDPTVLVQKTADATLVDAPSVLILQSDGGSGPAGAPGPPGPGAGTITVVAAVNISQYSVVRILADGQGYLADRNDLTHGIFVAGIATISALTGEDVTIITDGLLSTPAIWTVGALFVGDAGALISTPPPGTFTDYQLQVAVAVTTSKLLVRPQIPIFNP